MPCRDLGLKPHSLTSLTTSLYITGERTFVYALNYYAVQAFVTTHFPVRSRPEQGAMEGIAQRRGCRLQQGQVRNLPERHDAHSVAELSATGVVTAFCTIATWDWPAKLLFSINLALRIKQLTIVY